MRLYFNIGNDFRLFHFIWQSIFFRLAMHQQPGTHGSLTIELDHLDRHLALELDHASICTRVQEKFDHYLSLCRAVNNV